MATKKAKTKAAAGASEGEVARTVRYVLNRPYSAGEPPEVVTAAVKKEHDEDPDLLDLVLDGAGDGEAVVKGARRSDRQEPGTWFEG